MNNLIKDIGDVHRERNYFMWQRIPIVGRMGAFLRGRLGWSKDLPQHERKAIEERTENLIDYGMKLRAKEANEAAIAAAELDGTPKPRRLKALPEADPLFAQLSKYILTTLHGVAPIWQQEDEATLLLEQLADRTPVAEWWKANVFESTRMLGCIIGEAGDLGNYTGRNGDSKLWKRMGVAVMDLIKDGEVVGRVRQGAPGKDATADDWIRHAYKATRRAVLAVTCDSLIKGNAHYKAVYDKRKEYLRERAVQRGLTVVPAAKIPKRDRDRFISLGHIDKDAKRYMGKRLLRDLWRAWRRAIGLVTERSSRGLPAAPQPPAVKAAGERRATGDLAERPALPLPAAPSHRRYPDSGYELPHA